MFATNMIVGDSTSDQYWVSGIGGVLFRPNASPAHLDQPATCNQANNTPISTFTFEDHSAVGKTNKILKDTF